MIKNTLICLMAGGTSSRLWPITTSSKPKQFFSTNKLLNNDIDYSISMFENALKRNSFSKNIVILTNKRFKLKILNYLKKTPEINSNHKIILGLEEKNYNTGICSIMASILAQKLNLPTVILVPVDHVINDLENYKKDILSGVNLAKNKMILLGVKPNIETKDYGYIDIEDVGINNSCADDHTTKDVCAHVDDVYVDDVYRDETYIKNPNFFKIKSFKEKPLNPQKYMNQYWNSGIYILDPDVILNFIKDKPIYSINSHLKKIKLKKIKTQKSHLMEFDLNLPNVNFSSIDMEITQNINNIFMIKAKFDWIDIGTYKSIWYNSVNKNGKNGNVIIRSDLVANTVKDLEEDSASVKKSIENAEEILKKDSKEDLIQTRNSYLNLDDRIFIARIDDVAIIKNQNGQIIKNL